MRSVVAIAVLAACTHADPPPRTLTSRAEIRAADAPADRDGDEIPDVRDACPDKAEDFDLHEDGDGCPDLDDDRDGVPDEKDSCFDTPGDRPSGCPSGCYHVVSTVDCLIITPIWHDGAPLSSLDDLARSLKENPEIRELTLESRQRMGQPAGTARARLELVKKALVERGVPASMLKLKELDMTEPTEPISTDVFGQITKQRFDDGSRFRDVVCVDPIGAVYKVARERNYACHPVVCGDGICDHGDDEDTTCPADCPP